MTKSNWTFPFLRCLFENTFNQHWESSTCNRSKKGFAATLLFLLMRCIWTLVKLFCLVNTNFVHKYSSGWVQIVRLDNGILATFARVCKSLSPFHKTIPGKCRGLLTSRKDSLRQTEKLQFEQQQQKCGHGKPLRKTKKDSAYLWNAPCDKNLLHYRRLIITTIIIIIITTTTTIIPLFTLRSIYSTNVSGAEQMPETNNSNWT